MTDIKDTKKLEQELLLSSEIIKNMADGVYLVRISDGIIVYTNPKFEQMFGYNMGEMLGEHVAIVNAPTDKNPKETAKEIMEIVEKTGEWHGEVNNIKKDGTPFWCYANVSVFDHPEYGKVLIAVHNDITERKKVEGKYQMLVEKMSDGLGIIDPDGRITFVNAAFCNMWGYEEKEIVGHLTTDFLDDENKAIFLAQVELRKKGIAESYEITWSVNKGKVTTLMNPTVIYDSSGKMTGAFALLTDITGRKKDEESSTRLALMAEITSDYISIADMEGNLLYLNESGKKMIGLNPDVDISKLKIADMHPAWAGKLILEQGLPKALEKGIWHGETALLHRGGHEIPVSQVIMIHKNSSGEVDLLATIIRDISDRKKMEATLKESEERYKTLLDTVPLCIKLFDSQGKLVSINKYGRKEHFLEGKSEEEIKQWSFLDCVAKSSRADIAKKMEMALQGQASEFLIEHEPGTSTDKWCESSLTPVKNSEGKIEYTLLVSRDVTERKKVEEELTESNSRFQALADAAPLCIKWFDPEGNLVDVNKHGREEHHLEGKTQEEIRNWKYMDCIEEKCHQEVKDKMHLALEGKSTELLLEHVPGTATGLYCQSNLVPVKDSSGKVKYVLFISRDVTSEKEAESQKTQNFGELQKFKELTIGRELKMVELKKELDQANKKIEELGQK